MLALERSGPVYGAHLSRLRKDETVVVLILRLFYEEGISSPDERGRVEITTDDIHDRLRAAGEEPPAIPRLKEILRGFQRRGLVRLGDRDPVEQLLVVTIMPGVAVLVPGVFVDAVARLEEACAEAQAGGAEPPASSVLAHVAAARASLGAAAEPPRPGNDEEPAAA